MQNIYLTIDDDTLKAYSEYYFQHHPKAQNVPIKHPYHESINTWMILRRPMMNSLKQRWKDFTIWLVNQQGYTNLRISQCEMSFKVYYPNKHRHDIDNTTPKFILDGLVESGLVEDDDCTHITKLILECDVDAKHPRTEIKIICPE